MKTQLRLMVVEEQAIVSVGLSSILDSEPDMTVVSEVQNVKEAVLRLRLERCDVVLVDVRTRKQDNVSSFKNILQASGGAKILVFSAQEGDGDILRALKAGASGYMLKNATREEIVKTVRRVAECTRYLSPHISQRITEYIGMGDLTAREIEVLALVREGCRNRKIAGKLNVAETTVNFHIRNSLAKLAANDRTHAVTIAMRRGLLGVSM